MKEIYNKLITRIDKKQIFLNEPMKNHTTFKVGGPADIFIKVNNIEELKFILEIIKENNVPLTVIGNGSNILVKDGGIRGVVIKLNFNEIVKNDDDTFLIGAGVLMTKLSRILSNECYEGLEFACGIPGTFAGAVTMNAGAYGSEISNILISSTYIDKDLNIKTISKEEHDFKYRNSIFNKKDWIILSSKIKLKKGLEEEINKKIEENNESRKSKQPINFPSAGSTFKRGDGYITAELIDKCGLKGYNIGDAYVSDIHAGFVVNKGNATAKNILQLVQHIKDVVYKKFNINIELEIKILGEDE